MSTQVLAEIDDKKATIVKNNCIQAQVTVQQIRYNDAATRVNRGQGYETLLSEFINPLNSRAAANGFNSDAASLASIATRYQKDLVKFKNDYELYDDTISLILRIKCRDKTEIFYELLEKTREQRTVIAADTASLSGLTKEYRAAVEKLEKSSQ